jgi:hypothetical protein
MFGAEAPHSLRPLGSCANTTTATTSILERLIWDAVHAAQCGTEVFSSGVAVRRVGYPPAIIGSPQDNGGGTPCSLCKRPEKQALADLFRPCCYVHVPSLLEGQPMRPSKALASAGLVMAGGYFCSYMITPTAQKEPFLVISFSLLVLSPYFSKVFVDRSILSFYNIPPSSKRWSLNLPFSRSL